MIRNCILVLSISIFLAAGFVFYKASLEQHLSGVLFGSALEVPHAGTAPPPAVQASPTGVHGASATPVPLPDEPPVDTDEVFRKMAVGQLPRANRTSDAAPGASGELEQLVALAEQRALYARQVEELSAALEPILTERLALLARRESLQGHRAEAARQREGLATLDAERTRLEEALHAAEQEVVEKAHALDTARDTQTRHAQARERAATATVALDKLKPKIEASAKRRAELLAAIDKKTKEIAVLEDAIALLQPVAAQAVPANGTTPPATAEPARPSTAEAQKAAATLVQKQLAKEQAVRAFQELEASLATQEDTIHKHTTEQQALQREIDDARALQSAPPPGKDILSALETALAKAKAQRQTAQEALNANAKARASQAESLAKTDIYLAELDEIDSALAEAELQIARFEQDRDTYQSQLPGIDERLRSLEERARLALAALEGALPNGSGRAGRAVPASPEGAGTAPSGRSLVISLNEGTFAPGNATLQETSRRNIDRALAAIRKAPNSRVSVEGHTDSAPLTGTGLDQFGDNLNLSYQRAKAVADRLISGGVNATAVTVTAYGSGSPLASNDTPEGRARNRRVEIWLVMP
ncbi:OmpA family protein [Megalodesulfovibrio paquesii]